MSNANWRTPIDFKDWTQAMEKRVGLEERRPTISSAADLLGPGAGPWAVETNDWNDEACTFTGVFFGSPMTGQVNSPDDAKYWMGEVFSTQEGFGFQRLTQYRLEPSGTGSWTPRVRRFRSVSDLVVFGGWETP